MKFWLLPLLISSAFCEFAIAQMSDWTPGRRTTSERQSKKPAVKREPASNGAVSGGERFYFSVLYSSANEATYKGDTVLFGTPAAFSAKETTEGALGFAAGFRYRSPNWFGFDGAAAYELPRKSKGISGSAGTATVTGTYEGDVSTSLLGLAGNMNYSIGSSFYLSAGINFPVVFSSGNQALSGLLGYQMGGGYELTENFSLHLDYRVLRMKGIIDVPPLKLTIEEATFPGFLFYINYSL